MYQTCACVIHINLTHCLLHACQSYIDVCGGVHVLHEALVVKVIDTKLQKSCLEARHIITVEPLLSRLPRCGHLGQSS